jgi:ketosteroid isomerase-like protein
MSPATNLSQEAARAIRALEADFERHANAGNADAIVDEFYAEDAQVLPPASPVVGGRAAIREFWKSFLAAGCTDLKLETTDIHASGDLAYGVGGYRYTMAGERHTGKYVVVYRRQPDGDYRAMVDSFSDNA